MAEIGSQQLNEAAADARYSREPVVEAQIARLLSVPRSRLGAVALAGGYEQAREETLVHLIRHCHAEGDSETVTALLGGLVRRVNAKIARTIAVWKLSYPQSLADDVIDEVLMDFYDQVLTCDETTLFWEVRFWVCMERRLLNIVRRWSFEREYSMGQLEADDDGDTVEEKQPATLAWDDDPQMQLLIDEALTQLPDDWRTAFVLRYWAGYAIDGDDGGSRDTIATIMGLTGRTVRNYLARAEKRLAAWRVGINKVPMGGSANG